MSVWRRKFQNIKELTKNLESATQNYPKTIPHSIGFEKVEFCQNIDGVVVDFLKIDYFPRFFKHMLDGTRFRVI